MDGLAVQESLADLGGGQIVDGAGEEVAVEDDEVGELAGFEGADLLFAEKEEGVVGGVEANGLFAGEGFFWVQRAVVPTGFAGDGGAHGEEGVVGIDTAQGTDLLHVVGAAAGNGAGFEEALEGLEVAHALVAELGHEGAGVEIEPGGLDVGDHAEAGEHGHRFAAHEVAMSDARAGLANR